MTTVNYRKLSPPPSKNENPKEKGFLNRTRIGGKSIWDWMQLLIIPFILITVGYFFSNQQAQTSLQVSQQQHVADQRQAIDQQRATMLQTYMDNIQDLLLNHNLLKSKPTGDVATLARARTLTALQGLDPGRRGLLVLFLYEAKLIGFCENCESDAIGGYIVDDAIINLSRTNLSGADLSRTNLSGINLSGIPAMGVLSIGVDLSGADLSGTDLSEANLNGANLNRDNLSEADLSGADLSEASNLTQQQLDQVYSCSRAMLPEGLACHQDPRGL